MVIVRKQKDNRCRGAAAVEVALVLPVLLLVTFGAIRYGWFFLKAQQITNAARYGARVAVRADASTQDVLNAISGLLGPYGADIIGENEDPPVTFIVYGETRGDIGDVTPPPEGEDPIGVGDSITVIITVPAADVDIMPLSFFDFEPEGWNITASVTMPKEGF
jgi:hypothetical protein